MTNSDLALPEYQRSDLRRLGGYLRAHRVRIGIALASALIAAIFLGSAVSLIRPLVGAVLTAPQPGVEQRARGADAQAERPASAAEQAPRAGSEASEASEDDALLAHFPRLAQAKRRAEQWFAPLEAWVLERGYVRVPLLIVLLYVLKGLFTYVAVYQLRKTGVEMTNTLRQQTYDRVLEQSDEFHRDYNTGGLINRLVGDVNRIQRVVSGELATTLQAIPTILVLFVVAMLFAWQVTAACLVAVPFFALTAERFGSRVKNASRRSQENLGSLTSLLEETLVARRVVQAFDALGYESKRFGRTQRGYARQELRVARATALTSPAIEVLGALVGAALIIYAGSLMKRGAVGGDEVLVAITSLFLVFANVRRLTHLNNALQQTLASARRVFEVLDRPLSVRDREDARSLPGFEERIGFEGVSFTYGRGPVLRDVSLELRRGEVHALVGPSGAGKSTLAMLIPRFMDPAEGSVKIDGVDLRELRLASLREHIALVTQETHLFDDSVWANIAYGRPDAERERIREAASAAHAASFIEQLPEGYDTPLGERGSRLSAGQRQRIAIARAFLKDAPILILDEATSALDTESEHLVQVALEALLEGRTALIIAHRLSTVRRADMIHVLDEGRIVESGRHEELVEREGAYARLHRIQQAG